MNDGSSDIPIPPARSTRQVPSALQASDVIGEWYWDHPDRFSASRSAAEFLGLDPSLAVEGVPGSAFLATIHPEDRDWLAARDRAHARKGGPYVAEYRILTANGVRWVMSRGRYYLDAAGDPLGGCGVLIDVTDARLDGEDAEATAPRAQVDHPVLRMSKHALALRHAIDDIADAELRAKADALLAALGFAIARLIAPSDRRLN